MKYSSMRTGNVKFIVLQLLELNIERIFMNIAKFEYWAKRKGMSCVRAKQGFDQKMYSNDDTELAYNYWLAALSNEVEDLHEE